MPCAQDIFVCVLVRVRFPRVCRPSIHPDHFSIDRLIELVENRRLYYATYCTTSCHNKNLLGTSGGIKNHKKVLRTKGRHKIATNRNFAILLIDNFSININKITGLALLRQDASLVVDAHTCTSIVNNDKDVMLLSPCSHLSFLFHTPPCGHRYVRLF